MSRSALVPPRRLRAARTVTRNGLSSLLRLARTPPRDLRRGA